MASFFDFPREKSYKSDSHIPNKQYLDGCPMVYAEAGGLGYDCPAPSASQRRHAFGAFKKFKGDQLDISTSLESSSDTTAYPQTNTIQDPYGLKRMSSGYKQDSRHLTVPTEMIGVGSGQPYSRHHSYDLPSRPPPPDMIGVSGGHHSFDSLAYFYKRPDLDSNHPNCKNPADSKYYHHSFDANHEREQMLRTNYHQHYQYEEGLNHQGHQHYRLSDSVVWQNSETGRRGFSNFSHPDLNHSPSKQAAAYHDYYQNKQQSSYQQINNHMESNITPNLKTFYQENYVREQHESLYSVTKQHNNQEDLNVTNQYQQQPKPSYQSVASTQMNIIDNKSYWEWNNNSNSVVSNNEFGVNAAAMYTSKACEDPQENAIQGVRDFKSYKY